MADTYVISRPQSVHGPWEGPSCCCDWMGCDGGGVFGFGAKGTFVLTAGIGFCGIVGIGFGGTVGGILDGLKIGDVVPAPGVGDLAIKQRIEECFIQKDKFCFEKSRSIK